MSAPTPFAALPAPIAAALEKRGFSALTAVQEAVLAPELVGRDLRISSQTGSGKTVALGFVLAPAVEAAAKAPHEPGAEPNRGAQPVALVIAPTRELATQLAKELGWLFAPFGVRVASVTGGTAYSGELRTLRTRPLVIAATPGRLVDHLDRKSIDPSAVVAVVLDEADQMLDLGFREELQNILGRLPETRRTHMVSATFSRDVMALAQRYQTNPLDVAGTPLGDAHEDIAHVIHLVRPNERADVLRNLLLMVPGERTLVFVRTRADASDLADHLSNTGFSARALHGDLEQWERTKTLDAFRSGGINTLVATDVAARGIDVPEVSRVIHFEPPGDSEAYTHRSGRTGRAGRKGTSLLLAPVAAREHVIRILRRAKIEATILPAPSAADVRAAAHERLRTELMTAAENDVDPGLLQLATELLTTTDAAKLVASLIGKMRRDAQVEPAEISFIEIPQTPVPRARAGRSELRPQRERERGRAPVTMPPGAPGYMPFRVTWGARHGADPRRLLALVCRRGNIRGDDVGAIRIGEVASSFEVLASVAEAFAQAASQPDARDPRVRITPDQGPPARSGARERPAFGPPKERPAFVPPAEAATQATAKERPAYQPPAERPHHLAPMERPAYAPYAPPAERPAHTGPAERPAHAAAKERPAYAPAKERYKAPKAKEGYPKKGPKEGKSAAPSQAQADAKKKAFAGYAPPKRKMAKVKPVPSE